MSIFYLAIGGVGGILFAVTFPDVAQTIHDGIFPFLEGVAEKVKDIVIDLVKEEVLK